MKNLLVAALGGVIAVQSPLATLPLANPQAEAKTNDPENLALNKPVEGTPGIYIQPENPARYAVENAVDGNLSSLWGPVGKNPTPADLIIDLEEAKSFNTVRFTGRSNDTVSRTQTIRVMISNDKENWTEAASRELTAVEETIRFDEVQSRYVMIRIEAKSGSDLPALAEVEIYRLDQDVPASLKSISSSEYCYLDLNETRQLAPEVLDQDNNPVGASQLTFAYSSSNPEVLSVSEDGMLSARAKGKAVITMSASAFGKTVTTTRTFYAGYITPAPANEKEEPTADQKDMMENRNYGLMMHFGINTFNTLQWSDGTIDPSTYNPETIDADQWARVASEAGMTHIVVVSMHHDGFCMWDTKQTDYKVTNPKSGNQTDVLKELSQACKKYGIKLGLYYSLWNRHESYYSNDEVYNQHMMDQFTELLGGDYGEISEIWLDGAWDKSASCWNLPELYDHIKSLQPHCQVGVNQTIGINNGAITDPSNYQKYENIKYFPTDFKTWDGKTIADYDEPKIFTSNGTNYYLPYEETVCVRNPFGGFSWFWDNSYNRGDLYPVEEIEKSIEKLHSRGTVFLLNMGIDQSGHMVADDIAAVYKAADAMGIAKGSAIGANQDASQEKKDALSQAISHVRGLDTSAYTRSSVKRMLEMADEAEAALNGGTLKNADADAWKSLLEKAEHELDLISESKNIALEKEVVNSTPKPYSNAFEAENALDGDTSSLWGPANGTPDSSITIDLGSVKEFDTLVMDGRPSDTLTRVGSYTIQAAMTAPADGSWNMPVIAENIECAEAKQTIELPSTKARYIRILINGKASDPAAFREIELYNNHPTDVPEADTNKTLLNAAIEYAQAAMADPDYSKVNGIARKYLEEALADALSVQADPQASQESINEAWARLVRGVHFLSMTSDPSVLESLVSQAAQIEKELDHYRGDTEAFAAALEAARAVLADPAALDERIMAAAQALDAAMQALTRIPDGLDTSMLDLMIETAQLVDLDRYVEEGKTEFTAALAAAIAVQKAPESQQQVDQAAADLEDAYLALRLKADESLVQQLRDFLSAVESMDLSMYTDSVLVQIEECRAPIEAALKAHDSGQHELDQPTALKLAKTAEKGMQLLGQKKTALNKTALDDAIKALAGLKQSEYTDASWNALQTALQKGREILNDPNASQADLDAVLEEISSLKNALVKAGTNDLKASSSVKTASSTGFAVMTAAAGASLAGLLAVIRRKKD